MYGCNLMCSVRILAMLLFEPSKNAINDNPRLNQEFTVKYGYHRLSKTSKHDTILPVSSKA